MGMFTRQKYTKTQVFLLHFLKAYRQNCFQNDPCSHGSMETTKNAALCMPGHYLPMSQKTLFKLSSYVGAHTFRLKT